MSNRKTSMMNAVIYSHLHSAQMCYSGGKLRPRCGDVDDDDARGAEQEGRKEGREGACVQTAWQHAPLNTALFTSLRELNRTDR